MGSRNRTHTPLEMAPAAMQLNHPDADREGLDWLAREALLVALEQASELGLDWPGWSRTTISGSKVQRPAFRRRASSDCRNLSGPGGGIKSRGERDRSPPARPARRRLE